MAIKRKPLSVGEMLEIEFLEPMNVSLRALSGAMGVGVDEVISLK